MVLGLFPKSQYKHRNYQKSTIKSTSIINSTCIFYYKYVDSSNLKYTHIPQTNMYGSLIKVNIHIAK